MNTKFELNKSYKFDFNRKDIDKNGYTYFYLKYEGTNTMPEYDNTPLKFRVKAPDFLKGWTEEEIREKMSQMSCVVRSFYEDHHDGELPLFPYLVLDQNFILRQFFEMGKTYLFTVEGKEIDSNTSCEYYSLRDEKINQQHRYYFKKAPLWFAGDKVELMVDGFSDKAYLQLSLSPMENLKTEITRLEPAEDLLGKRENESLEFKSSFVYTPGGKVDIDGQLGHEIMAQLAGFMNVAGGIVCLGYKDDGSVRGLNEDIPFLNTSKIDKYNGQYKETLGGIELKIRNMIKYKLGADADPLVQVEFYRAQNDRLVCLLKASPSHNNIYVDRDEMYVRAGNICRRLLGDERIRFDQNKHGFKNPIVLDENIIKTDGEASPKYRSAVKVLTLYKNGDTSSQSSEVKSSDVLFNIPLTEELMSEKGRLVFLYEDGYVNIMEPAKVIKKKFTDEWKRYSNGFNTKANLLKYCVCTVDDTLCVYTEKKNGQSDVESFEVANYKANESMQTPGKRILKKEYSKIIDIQVVHKDSAKRKLVSCAINDAA